jgi:hypothetical protein
MPFNRLRRKSGARSFDRVSFSRLSNLSLFERSDIGRKMFSEVGKTPPKAMRSGRFEYSK